MIFRYAEYRAFLLHLRANFPLTTFSHWQGSNGVLLRHDVDFDLVAAHHLATLERECDVPATFFIRTAAAMYNAMSVSNREILSDMVSMGFEIGLHFDPSIYGDVTESDLEKRAKQESAILESIVDRPVESISLHNPSVHGKYVLLPGYRNAYDPELFGPEIYISDSRMVFRHDIYQFVERAKHSHVQLLLHPFHFSHSGATYPELVCDLVADMVDRVDSEFSVNSTYVDQMDGDLLHSVLLREVLSER